MSKLNEVLEILDNELYEQDEKTLEAPNIDRGIAVEIEQDQQTAQKILHYFIIQNGKAKFIKSQSADKNAPEVFTNFAGKYESLFYTALEAISRSGQNKRFSPYNVNELDIVGYWSNGDYKIIATGDAGQLQLEFDSRQKKWKSRS